MTSEGLGEMFEGELSDIPAGVIGGQAMRGVRAVITAKSSRPSRSVRLARFARPARQDRHDILCRHVTASPGSLKSRLL